MGNEPWLIRFLVSSRSVGWLVARLVGWLPGWLFLLLPGWFVSCLIAWLVYRGLVGCQFDYLPCWLYVLMNNVTMDQTFTGWLVGHIQKLKNHPRTLTASSGSHPSTF